MPSWYSKNYGHCVHCGMKTPPKELFKFEGTFKCSECLIDVISKMQQKATTTGNICIDCRREHLDSHFELCVDCRVKKRQASKRRWYEPVIIDMTKYPEFD